MGYKPPLNINMFTAFRVASWSFPGLGVRFVETPIETGKGSWPLPGSSIGVQHVEKTRKKYSIIDGTNEDRI
jgi:hypothetical protein